MATHCNTWNSRDCLKQVNVWQSKTAFCMFQHEKPRSHRGRRISAVHSSRFKTNECVLWGFPDLMFRVARHTAEGPAGLASLESWTKFYTALPGWRLWVDAASWWFQYLWQASDIPDPLPFLQIALYFLLAVVCNAQFVSMQRDRAGAKDDLQNSPEVTYS